MAGGLIGDIELLVVSVAALVALAVVGVRLRRDMAGGLRARPAVHTATIRLGLLMSVTAILVMTLLPRPWLVHGGTNLVPFSSIWEIATNSVAFSVAARNLGGNVLLFVPFGFFFAAWRRSLRPVRSAMGAATGFAIAVELCQAVLPLGRAVDVDDILLNVCGAAIGAVGYVAAAKLASRGVLAVRRSSTRTPANDSPHNLSRPRQR